jgi:hypothetical protein
MRLNDPVGTLTAMNAPAMYLRLYHAPHLVASLVR